MENRKKTDVMDGYTVVRLVKHAKDSGVEPARKTEAPPSSPKPERAEPVRHISRTVQPTKRPLRCYECGYEFQITGRIEKTYCPKCRASLELTDHTIESDWSQDLKTAGTIHILPAGVIKGGCIIGHDIILEGKVEGGRAEAFGTLEVRPGAVFSEEQVKSRHLRVAQGVELSFQQKRVQHNVEVLGLLSAEMEVTGRLEIRAGGHLMGRVQSKHLMVEEGGGLTPE